MTKRERIREKHQRIAATFDARVRALSRRSGLVILGRCWWTDLYREIAAAENVSVRTVIRAVERYSRY